MRRLRLLCTDLDRTLIPNGTAAEVPGVRQQLARYLQHHQVQLAYVSGRDPNLIQQAIAQYQLPVPDFVIADVGTTICCGAGRAPLQQWHDWIGADWRFAQPQDLFAMMADLPGLQRQEDSRQGRYKLSFYTALDWNQPSQRDQLQARFDAQGWKVALVYSVDDARQCGLLDVIPARAGKRAAIQFLLRQQRIDPDDMLFAGDSGNDLDVLCSELPAVLVANATGDVRRQALHNARAAGQSGRLYVASGTRDNGHYAAGILEGIHHFFPDEDEPS